MNIFKALFFTLVFIAFPGTGAAYVVTYPIVGGFAVEGDLIAVNGSGILDATIFNFANPVTVTTANGSFQSLMDTGTPFLSSSITFNTFDLNSLPVTPLLTARISFHNPFLPGSAATSTTYVYDLESVTNDDVISGQVRILNGLGTMHGTAGGFGSGIVGYEDTLFTWMLMAQLPAVGESSPTFSFSIPAVSLPGAVWLFCTALVGLVGFSKRRKAA